MSHAIAAVMVASLNVGCILPVYVHPTVDKYEAADKNVARLKQIAPAPTAIATFTERDKLPPLTVRTHFIKSPYANSFSLYMTEALKAEFDAAGRWAGQAPIEVSGQLLENDIDSSWSGASVMLEARFVVRRDGVMKYDAVKTIKRPFPSAFDGPLAIPRAAYEYQFGVQDLLAQLYADPDFAAAIQ